MGEVGEAIPDKSTVDHISPIMITAASSIAIASNRNSSPVQQNGDVLKAVTASSTSDEPMIIDSDDDDSCDNQSDTKIGESINANGDVEISRDFYDEKFGSKDGLDEKDLIEEENCSDYEEDRKSVEKKSGNSTDNEESQDGRESGSPTSHDEIEDGEDAEEEDESSESTTNDSDSRSLSKGSETKNVSPETVGKLNGEAKSDEGAVVNLSDSDDDMESAEQNVQRRDNEVDPIALPVNVPISEPTTLRHNTTDSDGAVIIGSDSENEVEEQTEVNLLKQQNSQSQQPVEQILPQSQNIEKPQFSVTPQHMKQDEDQAPQQVQAQVQRMEQNNQQPPKIDDDDDDCVLIEDDSPTPSPAGVINRQQNSMVKVCDFASIGENHTSDDSQPPAKRQKTSFNPVPPLSQISQSPMSQITIKDARSLMPPGHNNAINPIVPGKEPTLVIIDTETNKTVSAAFPHNVAYPGNLRPQLITGQPSAQMAQISKNMPLQVNPPLPSIPTTSNANLLPGLTDDMFVLEAPSFIVPYIYEKPPSDNLRNIVTQIETKFDFNSCETEEQNVVDNIMAGDGQTADSAANPANAASKKKKRKHGSGDESWSECDDSADEEDEDDSGSETRTKVLIKEANDDIKTLSAAIKPIQISNSTNSTPTTNVIKQQIGENYFESPLGKFFMDIGAGLVQEFVQADLIRIQKRKLRRSLGKNITELERTVAALSGNLEASKKRNAAFKFNIKRCEFCNFKSESALAMAHHYETPHMNGVMYKCNFCSYEIRNSTEIVYHMEAMHNIKARLFKHLPYHQCPNCGFEDNGRAKLARHAPVCVKKFRPEVNLAPPHDWEAPAKIPRIKPRHGLVGTATAYQAMAAQAAAQKAALASIQQQHQQAQQARNLQAAMVNNNVNKNVVRGRPQTVTKTSPNGGTVLRGTTVPAIRSPMPTGMVMPNNYQIAAGQLIQVSGSGLAILPTSQNTLTLQTANAAGSKKNQPISGQPSISITPLPRQTTNMHQGQSSPSSSNKLPPPGVKPGQIPPGNKNQFVICEICDGYIKDLEQLRNHMQWMHKVKIHPKMIYNRPPLNCQKCQFRFFTDQGLERHLLGSHGLVTSSMQEAANKGKDAGRCPVCGRMYQWKLLNHVSRDHHMTLKPAHLSYKCTVCTATFGMYKQFETHVYTAHSTVAKKAMDGKKSNSTNSGIGNSSSGHMMPNRSGLSSSNDSLLKPLKINDEITIIPQPAAKNRASMHPIESHVID